ncbi:MAG: helix-turn-helix transcriptional regulator [Hyphomicrobiales bacterium]|nr:helix-turn-helix transcriptional regulator [Hyphomicrobiales bacterium]
MTAPPLVRRSPVAARHCNLARGFELIGDRWTLLILRSALYGVRRFDDLQADLDIPRSVLSHRLAGLVASGIMAKRKYREKGHRTRIEYPLTKMGRALGLPFFAMTEWGDKWLGDGVSPMKLRSKATGQRLSVALVDENGRIVKRSEVKIEIAAAPEGGS